MPQRPTSRLRGLNTFMVAILGLALLDGRTARAQTLQDAMVSAYNASPLLLAERAALRATDESVPIALSNWRPTVQFTASTGIEHEQINSDCSKHFEGVSPCSVSIPPNGLTPGATPQAASIVGQGNFNANISPQTYALTISQPIYRGGRTEAQTEQALNLVRAERARLLSTEQAVLLNAVTDYMNVVRDQAALALSIENEELLRQQLVAARDRVHLGEINDTDLAVAEAAHAAAAAQRQQAEGNLTTSQALFERDIGESPGQLAMPDNVPPLPTSRDDATKLAVDGNPDVISAQFGEQAAEDNIRLVRGQLLPTVSLSASASRQNESLIVGQTVDDLTVMEQLTVPLFDGGAAYAQSRQAQETAAQRRNQVDQARLVAAQLAAQSFGQLGASRGQISWLETQIKSSEAALTGLRQDALIGTRSLLDVLTAEQALFQARLTLVTARHDLVVAEFSLAAATGRLTAEQLNLPVPLYDPQEHFDAVKDKWVGFGDSK